MANDRLSIGCTRCGYRLTLAKYYPREVFVINQEMLQGFLESHLSNCHSEWGRVDLGPESGLVIVTEAGEEALDAIVQARIAKRAEQEVT